MIKTAFPKYKGTKQGLLEALKLSLSEPKCGRCYDSGTYPQANLKDDIDIKFCNCKIGKKLETKVEMEVDSFVEEN